MAHEIIVVVTDEYFAHHKLECCAEIIRCADCKRWNDGRCDGIPFVGDDSSYVETEEEDFCSYAEKRE